MPAKQPAELLTIAHHVLGTGQLSLAKFLFITADESNQLSTHNIQEYLSYIFERIDFTDPSGWQSIVESSAKRLSVNIEKDSIQKIGRAHV